LRVGEHADHVERLLPRFTSFSVITAWNPRARQWDTRSNQRADASLLRRLQIRGLAHWPAMNGEGDWSEPAWLVGNLPLPQLDLLARESGQFATLHWRRGALVGLRWHIAMVGADAGFMDAERPDP